jgi:hypothetical protein
VTVSEERISGRRYDQSLDPREFNVLEGFL